jgi:DNA polymerase delta subunit 3
VIQHELKNAEKYVKAWQDSNRGVQFGAIRPPADVKLVDGQESGKKGIVDTASEVKARVAPALTAKPIKTEAKKKDEPKPKAQAKVVKDEDEEMLDDGPIGYADTEVDVTPAPTTKGGASSKRADAGDKKATLEEKRRRQKQELMDMMDEDRDGRADPEVRAAKSTSTSMMGGGDAGKSEKDTPVNKSSKVDDRVTTLDAASTPPVKEKQRVRKQRKVVRKEVTKNAKGYRITKDVEGYESYSSFESSEDEQEANSKKGDAPKKKAAANRKAELGGQELSAAQPDPTPVTTEEKANAVPPKKGGSGGQTSGQQKLSSFFKKK